MGIQTVTTITCDLCQLPITGPDTYLNAGTYGQHAHMVCFTVLTSLEVLRWLGLDEITHGEARNFDGSWWRDTEHHAKAFVLASVPHSEEILTRIRLRKP